MNRSSILRLSGILAAVAFALSFLVSAFNSLGGLVVLSRLGLDDRVMSRISAGENLLISVLLVAAFVVLSMDKENLAAGLIGAIRSGIYCIFAFGWLIGVPLISGCGIYFQSLVYIALAFGGFYKKQRATHIAVSGDCRCCIYGCQSAYMAGRERLLHVLRRFGV